jgi:hypothetical protein
VLQPVPGGEDLLDDDLDIVSADITRRLAALRVDSEALRERIAAAHAAWAIGPAVAALERELAFASWLDDAGLADP